MCTKAVRCFSVFLQSKLRTLLALLLVVGFLLGIKLSYAAQSSICGFAYAAGRGELTLEGLLTILFIPLLVSLIAFYYRIPYLILPVAFLKSVAFAFSCCSVTLAYGDGGWLVRFLLLFSDSGMFAVLCWYWLAYLDGDRCRLKQSSIICFVLAAAIGIVDYIYISPFLATLL